MGNYEYEERNEEKVERREVAEIPIQIWPYAEQFFQRQGTKQLDTDMSR